MSTATDEPAFRAVCNVDDIEVEGGVVALVDGESIAIFRTHDGGVYAMSNYDPLGKASVMARGIVGTRGGIPQVASPLHKQAYDLRTGQCLDDPETSIPTRAVRVVSGVVHVGRSRTRP